MKALISALEKQYGRQKPVVTDPFLQVLWENVAYLASDEKRAEAFALLEKKVGLQPPKLALVGADALMQATGKGILAANSAEKLQRSARIALSLGDLNEIVHGPLAQARKALRKFPGIGAPGADRILLLAGAHPTFSLESNGLRVLARVLFGAEEKDYAKTYKKVMAAVTPELPARLDWLQRAVLVLRRHGQETCKRSAPRCDRCPLRKQCSFAGKPPTQATGT